MILDSQLMFSSSQAITAAAGSTNTIDLSAVRDIGTGEELYIMVNVEVAFTDTGSDSTLSVTLEGDSTISFTPDGTRLLFTIPALAAVGNTYYARLNPGGEATQFRYIRLLYTPNTGNLTTGTISASIVHGIQKATLYPDAITIS